MEANCKSWLFTRPGGLDALVNLRASMLDEHAWFTPFVETCTAEADPWAKTGAEHSFPTIADAQVFGPLVAEYRDRGSRPV